MNPEYSWQLIWAAIIACGLTLIAKTLPITAIKSGSLPNLARKWLEFVPVAVMGALVGPDIFIYNGHFNLSLSNLFLLVSIPTALIAWKTANFFITIAAGIVMVILARYFGIA